MDFPGFLINGHSYPPPEQYFDLVVSTTVDGGFNINNQFVGQKIGRDRSKIDNLTWSILDAETWSAILKEFQDFEATIKMPDMVNNAWQNIIVYPGDRTATPYEFDLREYVDNKKNARYGLPTKYTDCKVNIIDTGWDV